MTDKTEAERLADELDKRVVTRWVHATGQTPAASGYAPDTTCRAAAAELRRLAAVEAELAAAREQVARLKTVMVAAAEEIHQHWAAHCDAEGYGPVNLMRRLEEGIPSQYGYTAGAFAKLQAQVARMEVDARRYQWLRSDATPPGEDCPAVYMMEAQGLLVGDELDAAIDAAMGKEQS